MDASMFGWDELLLVLIGFICGFFGVLVGGGSFITIPALIFVGLPPHVAIATNRVGLLGMISSGLFQYHKQKLIDYKIGLIVGGLALLGSIIGANLVLALDEDIVQRVIGILSGVLLIVILTQSERGLVPHKKNIRKREYLLGCSIAFFLGIYGGFYGAGVATLLGYVMIMVYGKTFLQSAGTIQVPMFLLSLTASIIFIHSGVVNYYYALLVFLSMGSGAFIAARHAHAIGNKWLKRMFVGIAFVMAIMLFL